MSNEKKETVADIVAALRAVAYIQTAESPRDVLEFANRIEAAAKREREAGAEAAQVCGEIGEMIGREATREKSSQVGNAAKMRDALEAVVKVGYPHNFQKEAYHIREYCYEITTAIKKCFASLASPPRNCDVGTADEQLKKFIAFCLSRKCNECPFVSSTYGECGVRWSQMQYEEGGAK